MKTIHKETSILQDEAIKLINFLAILIKTARMHNIDNMATLKAISRLTDILNPLVDKETITLHLIDDYFFLNGSRISFTLEHSANYDLVVECFKALELGEVSFNDTLLEDDIKTFISAFLKAETSETPFKTLTEETSNIPNIEIELMVETKKNIPDSKKKTLVKKNYSNAIGTMKSAFNNAGSNENIKFTKPKRVIGLMVDHISDEECLSSLFAMTTIKDYDDYTYYHSVNVSILSMALGHKIGLPRKVLADLGLAALFHDIGKVDIPIEVLNKTSELTENDWMSIKQHPLQGMMKLIQMKGFDETSIDLAISAFEHHINHDLSGYPDLLRETPIELFSKIISIADRYDAMTSSRVYSRAPKSPDEALKIMFESYNKEMDPCLLKFFIQMIGIYPVGSLVMLDSNEMGIVTKKNADPDFAERPMVLIITESSGMRVENKVVDLMEKDEDGNFRKSILKTIDSNKHVINLSEYLLLND